MHNFPVLFAVGIANIVEIQRQRVAKEIVCIKANLSLISVWNSSVACFLAKC